MNYDLFKVLSSIALAFYAATGCHAICRIGNWEIDERVNLVSSMEPLSPPPEEVIDLAEVKDYMVFLPLYKDEPEILVHAHRLLDAFLPTVQVSTSDWKYIIYSNDRHSLDRAAFQDKIRERLSKILEAAQAYRAMARAAKESHEAASRVRKEKKAYIDQNVRREHPDVAALWEESGAAQKTVGEYDLEMKAPGMQRMSLSRIDLARKAKVVSKFDCAIDVHRKQEQKLVQDMHDSRLSKTVSLEKRDYNKLLKNLEQYIERTEVAADSLSSEHEQVTNNVAVMRRRIRTGSTMLANLTVAAIGGVGVFLSLKDEMLCLGMAAGLWVLALAIFCTDRGRRVRKLFKLVSAIFAFSFIGNAIALFALGYHNKRYFDLAVGGMNIFLAIFSLTLIGDKRCRSVLVKDTRHTATSAYILAALSAIYIPFLILLDGDTLATCYSKTAYFSSSLLFFIGAYYDIDGSGPVKPRKPAKTYLTLFGFWLVVASGLLITSILSLGDDSCFLRLMRIPVPEAIRSFLPTTDRICIVTNASPQRSRP